MAFKVIIYDTDPMLAPGEVAALTRAGHTAVLADSDEKVLDAVDRAEADLVIIDTDIHGVRGNGFLFLKRFKDRFPNTAFLLTTERNVDEFMAQLVRYEVGNILVKPVLSELLLNVAEKLVTKQGVFGLHNYLHGTEGLKKIRLISSRQVRPTMDKILIQAKEWGFVHLDELILRLVMQEMMSNALYHSHGLSREKVSRDQIELTDGKFVEIIYGHNSDKFGISIIDYNGKLSKAKILDTLFDVAEQDRIIQNAANDPTANVVISESGRGIDLLRKLSGEFYFNIRRNFMTEILILFSMNYTKDDPLSSINIFEVD